MMSLLKPSESYDKQAKERRPDGTLGRREVIWNKNTESPGGLSDVSKTDRLRGSAQELLTRRHERCTGRQSNAIEAYDFWYWLRDLQEQRREPDGELEAGKIDRKSPLDWLRQAINYRHASQSRYETRLEAQSEERRDVMLADELRSLQSRPDRLEMLTDRLERLREHEIRQPAVPVSGPEANLAGKESVTPPNTNDS